jgi:hypothetical protein
LVAVSERERADLNSSLVSFPRNELKIKWRWLLPYGDCAKGLWEDIQVISFVWSTFVAYVKVSRKFKMFSWAIDGVSSLRIIRSKQC